LWAPRWRHGREVAVVIRVAHPRRGGGGLRGAQGAFGVWLAPLCGGWRDGRAPRGDSSPRREQFATRVTVNDAGDSSRRGGQFATAPPPPLPPATVGGRSAAGGAPRRRRRGWWPGRFSGDHREGAVARCHGGRRRLSTAFASTLSSTWRRLCIMRRPAVVTGGGGRGAGCAHGSRRVADHRLLYHPWFPFNLLSNLPRDMPG